MGGAWAQQSRRVVLVGLDFRPSRAGPTEGAGAATSAPGRFGGKRCRYGVGGSSRGSCRPNRRGLRETRGRTSPSLEGPRLLGQWALVRGRRRGNGFGLRELFEQADGFGKMAENQLRRFFLVCER